MSVNTKVLLCFQKPKPGGYIGGLTTLCNDYIDKSDIFINNNVDISCFNYEIPTGSVWNKIRNSKLRNLVYGYLQGKALKRLLKESPDTTIHIHTSRKALFFKDVLLARRIRKRCKGKILMTVHVGDISTVFHNETTKKYLIGLMNRSVDTVLFLSEKMKRQFTDAGLDESQAAVLYNFFNIKSIAPEEKGHRSTPQLLYIGSINREKGIIELLEAAHSIDVDFHLHLCGTIIEESIRPRFEELVKQLEQKVSYHGYVGKDKKEALLTSADILILPSYREGLPIAILEAMATSCGIISTPVGAIPEIISSDNAILIEPRDVGQLKNAIESLLNNNDALQRMKVNNYYASRKFTYRNHIKQLCHLYGR